jgi:DNA-binding transcriptional MerR regulator
VVSPGRSTGGHRRYSRRQLELAARLRLLVDAGLNLDGAIRITALEDRLEQAQERIAELEGLLAAPEDRP